MSPWCGLMLVLFQSPGVETLRCRRSPRTIPGSDGITFVLSCAADFSAPVTNLMVFLATQFLLKIFVLLGLIFNDVAQLWRVVKGFIIACWTPGVLYNKEVLFFNVICNRQYNISLLNRQSFDIPRSSSEGVGRVSWTKRIPCLFSCQSLIQNDLCESKFLKTLFRDLDSNFRLLQFLS